MPAQSPPNLGDLLRVLTAATDRNGLRWNQTADEDAFRTEFGVGMVRISKSSEEVFRYTLSLIDITSA